MRSIDIDGFYAHEGRPERIAMTTRIKVSPAKKPFPNQLIAKLEFPYYNF